MRIASLILGCSLLAAGCLERALEPLSPCLVSNVVDEVQSERIDKVDLLFVVDDSKSMKDEQVLLEQQFPNLIRALTTGDRDGDGVRDFEPATDLHLGVVSSDLGVPGVAVEGCTWLGRDGVMNDQPNPDLAGCETPDSVASATYPRFLTYRAGEDDPMAVARDFGCVAQVGTTGCGLEQQLEAGLKALWPSVDRDPESGMVYEPNRVRFLPDPMGFGADGQGDRANAGFLRGPDQGLSVLAVVVVSDEEDCSMNTTNDIPAVDPTRLNLRCFENKHVLYSIDRYVQAFRALRPGRPDLVLFAAIVGVPEDLVDRSVLDAVDFEDEAQREAFYQRILDDDRMQEQIDEEKLRIRPSCGDEAMGGGDSDGADPPRRIVEVARQFGEYGLVQSICGDDFTSAMDAIIRLIGESLDSLCVPRRLIRDAEGLVGCDIVWTLPVPGEAPAGTPTRCEEREFLEWIAPADADGGERCRVRQLAITSEAQLMATPANGWYYDDFTSSRLQCGADRPQQLAFTDAARPPNGVSVNLQCLEERPRLPAAEGGAAVGDPCDRVVENGVERSGDALCQSPDRPLFCHPQLHVCVQACATDADCPSGWACDDRPDTLTATASEGRPSGSPMCVNPTCGSTDP